MTTEADMEVSAEAEGIVEAKPARSNRAAPQGSKALLNFWLDVALLVAFLALIWVSAMMVAVFPAPTYAGGWKLWGLTYNQWRDIQFGFLCACALLALEHLVLHWKWVCGVLATKVLRSRARPDEGTQAVYGVATFIGLLLVMLVGIVAATLGVIPPPD